MEKQEIVKLHEELYIYLMGVHKENPSFKFRVRRMNNQNRLIDGYWFNGNDAYIETSFWDYKDNLHQTPIIRLVYYFGLNSWNLELIARDTKFNERAIFFKTLAKKIGGFTVDDEIIPTVWKKQLGNNNLIEIVNAFKKEYWAIINEEIDKFSTEKRANTQLIGYIDDMVFNKDIERIKNVRGQKELQETSKKTVKKSNSEASKIKLPYSLKSLDIEDFQGIDSMTIGFGSDADIPLNTQWIFLTGENGFGKTTILKAIAIGLTNDENEQLIGTESIRAVAYRNGEEISGDREDKKDNSGSPDIKNIVAYGVSRFMGSKNNQMPTTRTATLFKDDEQLISIEERMKTNETRFVELSSKLKEIMPKISRIEKKPNAKGDTQIRFFERDEQGIEFKQPVSLEQLGAGYRGIFMMMGDMIIRLSNDLEKSVKDISGIVIIDEFDAHLHPKYQYELPKLLSDAFPKVQFIVSTHSPIPLLGLPKKNKKGEDINAVVFTVSRTKEGITVERLDDDIPFHHLLPNSLLTSPIFGFDKLFPRDTPISQIASADHWEDVKESIDLQKELEQLRADGLID